MSSEATQTLFIFLIFKFAVLQFTMNMCDSRISQRFGQSLYTEFVLPPSLVLSFLQLHPYFPMALVVLKSLF